MSENQDPLCISLPGSALRAILDSRQSTHAGIPIIHEERAIPMITRVFLFLQTCRGRLSLEPKSSLRSGTNLAGGPRRSAEGGGEREKSGPRGEDGPGRLLGRAEGKEERRRLGRAREEKGKASSGLLSVETHRRAATGNTRSREAPGTAGGPRSLGQWPEIWHTSWRLGC
jgi:hypothetical protein